MNLSCLSLSLLVVICVNCMCGCSLQRSEPAITETTVASAENKKFPDDVEAFAQELEKVKMDHKDSVAIAHQQATQISGQFLTPKVPAKERKLRAKEVTALMRRVENDIPKMITQVRALKAPAAASGAVTHFIGHLEALRNEAKAYCVYAELASADDPTKNPKFAESIAKLNAAANLRLQEMDAFQKIMISLAVSK